MNRRVFLLGIDGGSWNLLDKLMAADLMPSLQRVCDKGCKAVLESTVPPVTPVAWSSLMTGANPGKHGVFGFTRPREDNSYLPLPCNRLHICIPTLFDYFKDGDGVVSLNLPMSYPATPTHGIMVTGMMTPLTGTTRSSFPEGTIERFRQAGIDYIIDPKFSKAEDLSVDDMFRQWQEAGHEFVEYLGHVTRQRMLAVHHLLESEQWELFIAVITGTDRLQHLHWNKLLPTDGREGDPHLLAYYTLVDTEIGRLLDTLNSEDTLLIVSDHGFVRLAGEMSASTWFLQNGFMQQREAKKNFLVAIKDILKRIGITRSKIARVIGGDRASRIQLRAASMDWGRARALHMSPAGFRLNIKGRETLGCVPLAEYESLREEIIGKLSELRDDDGDEVIARIFRREEIYHGDQIEAAPDILFLFREEKLYTAYGGGFMSTVFNKNHHKQADHGMDGIFVAHGGGIGNVTDLPRFHISDVLPTILYLTGRKIPAICDGRVLEEVLDEAPDHIDIDPDWQRYMPEHGQLEYGQSDVEEINERLKALGYLDD
ncbi:MAG: alkaline phosphatase family protein [bacterium]